MRNSIVKACLFLLAILVSSPSGAQLVGTDNTPGTACDKKGAVQMTANVTGPGAYILTCDDNAPSGKWVATINAGTPTANAQVANKQYVDTAVAASGGGGVGLLCVYADTCVNPFVYTGMQNIGGTGSVPNQKVCCTTATGVSGVTPSAFNFTDITTMILGTATVSDIVTINGIGVGNAAVSITGDGSPQVRINGGAWATSGTINNGQTLQVRLTSADSYGVQRLATVTVGTLSDVWSVTTADTCAAAAIGATCPEGGFKYAGTHNGNRLYTANTDHSTGIQWKTSGGTYDIATDSDDDGLANSNQIANSTTFPAFKLCKDIAGGTWYLPSRYELGMLYTNRAAIGSFVSAAYWSSTEASFNAIYWHFSNNMNSNTAKDSSFRVRCVRR